MRETKLRHARNVGRALFAVFGVLAVVGNVEAAPDRLSAQVWHALPPVAFMLTVEIAIVFFPELEPKAARIAYAATGFIAAASFALSFMSLRHVAEAAGMGWGSWLFPLLFEVAALTFSGVGIAAGRALASLAGEAERARVEEEAARVARVEAERARVEAEREEADARVAREEAERARVAALPPAERSQAERDALVLRREYGEALPTYRVVSEALGWSAGKQKAAREAYASLVAESVA